MQRRMPPHALGSELQVHERAGASVGRAGMGIEQEVRGGKRVRQRDGRRIGQSQRFHKRPAEPGKLRAVRGILVTVKLHEIELGTQRDPAGLVEREIHDHGDPGDERRQHAEPCGGIEIEETSGTWEEIETERIGSEGDGGGGVRAVRETADFHPHSRAHSMTFPCTCLICPWCVRI